MPMNDNPNHHGSSRRWIIREAEDSPRRLGTDWIDLYQIHRWDPETDLDETLGALSDLVHQGKIRYVGHSTFPAPATVEAQWTAQRRNRERFITEQPAYSILTRGIENDVLPTYQRYGMGVLSYSPGRRAAFRPLPPARHTRTRIGRPPAPGQPVRPRPAREPAQARSSRPARRRRRHHPHRARDRLRPAPPALTSAIIGPRTMEHLESQLTTTGVHLTDDVLDRIDQIVAPGLTLNPADNGWVSPALGPTARRR